MQPTRLLVTALLAAALAQSASAQQDWERFGPLAGEWLAGFDFSYTFANTDGQEDEELIGRLELGNFLGRSHELGLELAGRYQAIEKGGNAGRYFVGPLYNYNWYVTPRTTLYAGVRVGLEYADETGLPSHTDLAYGAQLGLRAWLTPGVALRIEPRFTRTELDVDLLDTRDQFDLLLGFNVVL